MARMPTLWGHQKKTFAFADTTDLIFDMSDPGTGKTRAHLAVYEKRRAKGKRKLLIVCPKTLMDTAWQDELDNSFPHLTYGLAYAPDRERDKQFARDVDVLAQALGTQPVLLVARQTSFDDSPVSPLPVGTEGIPNNHFGYAVQWFGLAAVWTAMLALFLWRQRKPAKGKEQ